MEGVGPVLVQEPHPPPSCWSRQPLRPQACPVSEMGLSTALPFFNLIHSHAGPPDTYHLPRHMLPVKKGVTF